MNNRDKEDYLLYCIAKKYYIHNYTQDAIAKEYHLSRPYISKLLDKAKERKIIKFIITNPQENKLDILKDSLKKAFNLKYVNLVYVSNNEKNHISKNTISERIADCAAESLGEFLKDSKMVAVGEGVTLYLMSKKLNSKIKHKDLLFMPAIGIATTNNPFFQSNIIVNNLATAFSSQIYFTNIPVVTDETGQLSELYKKKYKELTEYWKLSDTVLIGLGVPYLSSDKPFILNEATEEYKNKIADTNNVGDILTSFILENGEEVKVNSKYKRNVINLDDLRYKKKVLCLAGGKDKVKGIYTAIKKGYINCLITDSATAISLLSLKKSDI